MQPELEEKIDFAIVNRGLIDSGHKPMKLPINRCISEQK